MAFFWTFSVFVTKSEGKAPLVSFSPCYVQLLSLAGCDVFVLCSLLHWTWWTLLFSIDCRNSDLCTVARQASGDGMHLPEWLGTLGVHILDVVYVQKSSCTCTISPGCGWNIWVKHLNENNILWRAVHSFSTKMSSALIQAAVYYSWNLRTYLWWSLCALYLHTGHRQHRSLLSLCDVFWVLINSLVGWLILLFLISFCYRMICLTSWHPLL